MKKNYGIGYKLFEMNSEGKLFPLFIDKGNEVPIRKWIHAEYKPTKNFAKRGGWHIGRDTPDAPWLRGYDGSDLGPYKSRFARGRRVWCLVRYNNHHNYQSVVNTLPKKCIEDGIPEDGFYLFNEANRGSWVITSDIYVERILTEEEVRNILSDKNYDPVFAYKKYKKMFEKRLGILTN